MIERPTTLLLGAGASQHLGYPVGSVLLDRICSELNSGGYSSPEHRELYLGLSRGGFSSPDAYLELHTDQMEMGKYLIAKLLKGHEVEDRLFPPNNPGWYQYLFSRLATKTIEEFEHNQLAVVTFNYDRSLEAFLHGSVQYRFGLDANTAWEVVARTIPIVHVHGILGAYPDVPYTQDVMLLPEVAKQIKIIHEIVDPTDGFCSPDFEIANRLLQQADIVYALGFGFAETNIKRLRYFCPDVFTKLKGFAAAIGSQGDMAFAEFIERVGRFGIPSDSLRRSSCEPFFADYFRL